MSIISYKWSTAKNILHERGLTALLQDSLRLLVRPVYQHECYSLYEYDVNRALNKNHNSLCGENKELVFKVVASNPEADQLEAEGYCFRDSATKFNFNRTTYRRWLDCGATALCTFMGKEFAAIIWIISSQQTQHRIEAPPLKIDYDHKEVLPRGAWTNPVLRESPAYRLAFRNLILTTRNLKRYLAENGLVKMKSPVDCTNMVGQRLSEAMGFKKYGKARYLKIFLWKSWEETYFNKL